MTEVIVSPGVIVEHVGGELLVVVPGNTDVVKLTDGAAEVLLDIQAGKAVDLSHPAVSELVALGIVSAPGFSRRGLIKAGAIGAGAGVAVLAMPSVAAASSVGGDGDDDEEGGGGVQGIYQNDGGEVQFRVALSDLGQLESPGGRFLFAIDSVDFGQDGLNFDVVDGGFVYWTASGVGTATGTQAVEIVGDRPGEGIVSVEVSFTAETFSYPNLPNFVALSGEFNDIDVDDWEFQVPTVPATLPDPFPTQQNQVSALTVEGTSVPATEVRNDSIQRIQWGLVSQEPGANTIGTFSVTISGDTKHYRVTFNNGSP